MKFTNKHNLPKEVYDVLSKDNYVAGSTDFSATTLLKTPRQVQLQRRHATEITEDVIDRVWSLLGQAAHSILEKHGSDTSMTEERLYAEVFGRRISGQVDHYHNKCITDYKVTSVYTIIYGSRIHEWTEQLNCYDEKTEVLTKDGWKYFKDITKLDAIFSYKPETKQSYYQFPIAIQKYNYEGEMHHYKNNQVDLLVTPDHNMYIGNAHTKKYELRPSKDISCKRFKIKKTGEAGICDQRSPDSFVFKGVEHTTNSKYREDMSVTFSDFVEFMGWYLAEGWFISNSSRYGFRLGISQDRYVNYEKCLLIESLLQRMGIKYRQIDSGFLFNDKRIYEYVKQFGTSRTKYVPSIILDSSKEDIKRFLVAYTLGDGSKNGKGYQIITSSKLMCDAIQECILKIGDSTNILNGGNYQPNTEVFIVSWFKTRDIDVITSKQIQQYSGVVYDLSLKEDHIFMVRRNGKTCWSGNCYGWLFRTNKIEVDKLQIVAILRDWSETEASRKADYPQSPIVVIPLTLWSKEEAEAFVYMRVAHHKNAESLSDEDLPPCSKEDMWESPSKYAVMKEGRKSAIRVYDSKEDALQHIADIQTKANDVSLQERCGERRKCARYCSVNNFCSQWLEYISDN